MRQDQWQQDGRRLSSARPSSGTNRWGWGKKAHPERHTVTTSQTSAAARIRSSRQRTRSRWMWVAVLTIALLGLALWQRVVTAHPTVAPAMSRIATGSGHTCAVTADGHVKCWGDNAMGQLGDGTFTRSLAPVAVAGLEHVKAVASGSGSHTCALTDAGDVWCWGANETGQLGNNDTASSALPVKVAGLETALGIAVGRSHTCAVTSKGLFCWGENSSGELGNGSTDASLTPSPVEGFGPTSAIALGAGVSCGIADAARVACWGDDGDGQLGDQGFAAVNAPLAVQGIDSHVVSVSVSDTHVCVVTNKAEIWCWGSNTSGQIGIGSTSASSIPTKVPAVRDVASAIAGFQRTCVLHTTGGYPECWGGVTDPTGSDGSVVPQTVQELGQDVAFLSLGTFHGCLMKTGGEVRCWGSNTTGQLGDGSTADSTVPVSVPGF